MSEAQSETKPHPGSAKKVGATSLLVSVGLDPSTVSQAQVVTPQPVETKPPEPKPPEPKPRKLTWKTSIPTIHVGDTITAAQLVDDEATLSNLVITVPASGLTDAAADQLAVTVTGAAKDGFDKAEVSGTVSVLRHPAALNWKTPEPLLVNAPLGGKQLNATLDPVDLPVTYTPVSGTQITAVGQTQLSVACLDTNRYLPVAPVTVMLTVVADRSALAKACGETEMQTGRAWKPMVSPVDDDAIAMKKKWNDDKDDLKTKGKEVMSAVKDMTADQLKTYMNGKKTDKGFKDYNEKLLGPNGGPSEFPNLIWRFDNGLQVRFKPNGDPRNKGTPMFCVEVRTSDVLDDQQAGVACKLMPDGEPGAKGSDSTQLPDWLQTMGAGSARDDLEDDFMNAACGMTHLKCKPKLDQVITWNDPAEIMIGATLVGATALGDLVCTHMLAGTTIKPEALLPVGANQDIDVTTPGTDLYKPGTGRFKITVKKIPQVVTWAGPVAIGLDETLDYDHLCAKRLDSAIVAYTAEDGTKLTMDRPIGKLLSTGTHKVFATAQETSTYASGRSASIDMVVNKVAQVVTWTPPAKIDEDEVEASTLLNAEYLGKDEDGLDYQSIDYLILDEDSNQVEPDTILARGVYNLTVNLSDSEWYEDGFAEITVTVPTEKKANNRRKK